MFHRLKNGSLCLVHSQERVHEVLVADLDVTHVVTVDHSLTSVFDGVSNVLLTVLDIRKAVVNLVVKVAAICGRRNERLLGGQQLLEEGRDVLFARVVYHDAID